MNKKQKNYEILLTKDTIGRVLTDSIGYKVFNKQDDGTIEYTVKDVPVSSTFKVIGFNLYNKRVSVILYVRGITKDNLVVELDYDIVINNCTLENTNIFKGVESLLLICKERSVIDTKAIKEILLYLAFGVAMFLFGKI